MILYSLPCKAVHIVTEKLTPKCWSIINFALTDAMVSSFLTVNFVSLQNNNLITIINHLIMRLVGATHPDERD